MIQGSSVEQRTRKSAVKALVSRLAMGVALAAACALPIEALAASCKPRKPKPPITLTKLTPCEFDAEALSFAGDPVQQATCLTRTMDSTRNLGPAGTLPEPFVARVGKAFDLPTPEVMSTFLSKQDLERDFAAYLWRPLSRARDNHAEAPEARYFVIHDTSGPSYGSRPFPDSIDTTHKINNLKNFWCSDGWSIAHVVVNRRGEMLLGQELENPWRATKFERATNFSGALKGLFLHVELIQPRRRAPGLGRRNDAQPPSPAFTSGQYDRTALLYTIASVRAKTWMIPAFHAPIDASIRGGHDDPAGFNIEIFARSLTRLLDQLHGRADSQLTLNP